jgi:hypothetical protein
MHENQYQYDALNPKDGQTRILTLLPSSQYNSRINCVLSSVSIDPVSTPFEALSYTWGKEGDHCPNPIFMNGYATIISRNLESFLRTLRYKTLPRELWVDALCINQADCEEKSAHLIMMAIIYNRARRVIIWLGDQSSDSALAVSTLSTITSEIDFHRISDDANQAINSLFSRDWFTRVWVVQEFMLGREPLFVCGRERFE